MKFNTPCGGRIKTQKCASRGATAHRWCGRTRKPATPASDAGGQHTRTRRNFKGLSWKAAQRVTIPIYLTCAALAQFHTESNRELTGSQGKIAPQRLTKAAALPSRLFCNFHCKQPQGATTARVTLSLRRTQGGRMPSAAACGSRQHHSPHPTWGSVLLGGLLNVNLS